MHLIGSIARGRSWCLEIMERENSNWNRLKPVEEPGRPVKEIASTGTGKK
jgi:hypothetical protein